MEAQKNIHTLKSELKQLAVDLRSEKATIKEAQKEFGSGAACSQQYNILKSKMTYRHKHIVYSMMRGRTYEQIEPKCRKGNEPDQKLLQEITSEYSAQNVCAGS